jgi:hypothetical protein
MIMKRIQEILLYDKSKLKAGKHYRNGVPLNVALVLFCIIRQQNAVGVARQKDRPQFEI